MDDKCEVCHATPAMAVAGVYTPTLCETCTAALRKDERDEDTRLMIARYPSLAARQRSAHAAAE
jgi:hypothetical protein